MANDGNPDHRMLATGAKILLARIYRDNGDTTRSDSLIAEVAHANPARRALLFSPPYELASRETSEAPLRCESTKSTSNGDQSA